MAMVGADPFAIMNAMGHADFKTTMICEKIITSPTLRNPTSES